MESFVLRKEEKNMVKFGTGGWRAIIGEEFTKENIQKLALALCLKIKAEHVEDQEIVIGYDRRFLSKEAVIWACQIFGKQGIKVLFVDRSSPTPLIMFYVMKHELPYGLMVTASHNPAIYNGIKVFTKYVITGHHVSHRHANQQGGAGGHTGYEQASSQCRVIIFLRKETDIIFQGKLLRFR